MKIYSQIAIVYVIVCMAHNLLGDYRPSTPGGYYADPATAVSKTRVAAPMPVQRTPKQACMHRCEEICSRKGGHPDNMRKCYDICVGQKGCNNMQ